MCATVDAPGQSANGLPMHYASIFSSLIYLATAKLNVPISDIRLPIHLPISSLKERDDMAEITFTASFKLYSYYTSGSCQRRRRTGIAEVSAHSSHPHRELADVDFAANCNATSYFQPSASGGDGVNTWYCMQRSLLSSSCQYLTCYFTGFVGYHPTLNNVIISHQGTDSVSNFTRTSTPQFLVF